MSMTFLPSDCLDQIFTNLGTDKKSLHSCLLVNRLWFYTAVDKLWAQPFRFLYTCPQKPCLCQVSIRRSQAAALVKIYLACFASKDRARLLDSKVISTQVPVPLFDYVKLLRNLDIDELYDAVKDFSAFIKSKSGNRRSFFLKAKGDEYLALLKYFNKEIRARESDIEDGISIDLMAARVICRLLMANLSSLRALSIDKTSSTRGQSEFRCSTLEPLAIDQYGNHVSIPRECIILPSYTGAGDSLRCLSEFICTTRQEKKNLFAALAKVSRNLRRISVYLDFHSRGPVTSFLTLETELAQEAKQLGILISAQTQLCDFELRGCPTGSSYITKALATQAGTLTKLTFSNVGFGDWTTLCDLDTCTNIKSFTLHGCNRLTDELLQPLTNSEFRNLETLDMFHTSAPPKFLESMIESSGSTLTHVDLGKCDYYAAGNDFTRTVIDTVAANCPNIAYFASFVTASEMPQLVTLLNSCPLISTLILNGEHLPEDDASWLLLRFAKRELPNLRHFAIHAGWSFTPDSLERFLRETKVSLKTLEFSCSPFITDEHLDVAVNCLEGVLTRLNVYIFGEIKEETLVGIRGRVKDFGYEVLSPYYCSKDSVFCKMTSEWYQKPVGFYCRTTLGGFNI